ncbi:GTP pyrophosphokinase [Clostridium botulinum]|uniref:GTP pyrophosphokinase n=1 Tax=Clostridium botulinum TaxID=1491 RepID=UPI001E56A4E1|nr:GTP pyrophosphokinase [Clostridium botulinum]MCD3276701.1 GTP pyrophosphokinase [Clostridium botulinum C/D]MCD3288274.1 GTP pyrophosphokinase [Clostridium botulinum C/D]MCD3290809.1 GTP pyrophosphokinase [Clostridium botulinum C/D]MCD3303793.1 GTP pyrophosphokinase [Clostridium botulinum C/D]
MNKCLLSKAVILATIKHKNQVDKGGNPYILHPLKVMLRMDTNRERIVAVLHDIIEDTDTTLENLKCMGFDDDIIQAIDSITRRDGEIYIDYIRRCKQNTIARKVKLADLEDNSDLSRIKNLTDKDYNRLKRYKKAKEILLKED